jgi:hypothetical protein
MFLLLPSFFSSLKVSKIADTRKERDTLRNAERKEGDNTERTERDTFRKTERESASDDGSDFSYSADDE